MKNRRLAPCRLWLEELEQRLVPSTTVSTNWSGYAVATARNAVTSVSGTWVVPAVTGTGISYSSAWVGIDGWTSGTVEQIGTDSDVYQGVPQYYAWFEMYPAGSVNIPLSKVTIHPNDTINASVTYTGSGTAFALSLTDVTTGGTFSTTQSLPHGYTAQRSSAEWIQEAPSSNRGVLPLSNFGTINFSNATYNKTTVTAKTAGLNEVNMIYNTGALEATTSALSAGAFSVTFVPQASSGGGGHHGHGGHGRGRDPMQPTMPTTSNTDLQSASLQTGFQTGPSHQPFFATTPATNNAASQQQMDAAFVPSVTVATSSLFLNTTSLVGADEGETGDGWFAPDAAPPAEAAPAAEPVVEG